MVHATIRHPIHRNSFSWDVPKKLRMPCELTFSQSSSTISINTFIVIRRMMSHHDHYYPRNRYIRSSSRRRVMKKTMDATNIIIFHAYTIGTKWYRIAALVINCVPNQSTWYIIFQQSKHVYSIVLILLHRFNSIVIGLILILLFPNVPYERVYQPTNFSLGVMMMMMMMMVLTVKD